MNGSPVSYEVEYAESMNRPAAFYKWILAFPHYLILGIYQWIAVIFAIIAWVGIYRDGTYPRNAYDFIMGYLRWWARTYAYALDMRDEYPPFGEEEYPVRIDVPYPEGPLPKGTVIQFLKVIPVAIIASIFGLFYFVTVIFAAINIFRTGRYPEGLFRFALAMNRWWLHILAYAFGMVTEYPPFSVETSGVQLRIEPQEPAEAPKPPESPGSGDEPGAES
jgi:hypothetical protein